MKIEQLTQLVECFRHMEEVAGLSPTLPTKQKKRHLMVLIFFAMIFPDGNDILLDAT